MTAVAPWAPTNRILFELREAGEDFEWYPTTNEMLAVVARDVKRSSDGYRRSHRKILDIGAGDGRALVRLQELLTGKNEDHWDTVTLQQFAIEKSMVHLTNMPKHIVVIGTEFREQTLVDKEVDIVFCNPPYSEYEDWAYRILRECSAETVYLVIPRRWRDSGRLSELVSQLELEAKSLGEFDFENAERQARAKVEIVRFDMGSRDKNAAFDAAIEEMLPELDKFECDIDEEADGQADKAWDNQLAPGGSLIDSLVASYDAEQTELYETYRAVVKINPRLLKELGVTKQIILVGLREKIKGLKNKYWSVLFEHLQDVTKRLATKQRKAFLDSIREKTVIDFTHGNICSMLIWITKWSNDYFDEQLIELFRSLAQHANVHRYKSNDKVFKKGNWRYLDKDETHFKLDYRLVVEGFGGICNSQWSWESRNGLTESSHEFLSDFITIANNLGFDCIDRSINYRWSSGKKNELWLSDGSTLMDVRAFKNGNLHIRVAKRVMLAINVQVGKLLGWVTSAEQAVRELEPDAEDIGFVGEVFKRSNHLVASSLLRIEHVD
jgi:hypothetical protein